MWENLPDTADRFINIRSIEEGIGVLPSLLLKKENYRTMAGGDGACMGCGEKTAVHLIVSTIEALMQPRVEAFVEELDGLISELDDKARDILASDADLDLASAVEGESVDVPVDEEKQSQLKLYTDTIAELTDLRWRYVEGPSGQGRSNTAITNATVLPLYFLSGVFIPETEIPAGVLQFADLFPIRHFFEAFFEAFDPATSGAGIEWGHLAVIAVWGVAGLLVALRWFRWTPRGD